MQASVLGEFALLLGFELSSVIVDSLEFKRGSEVESEKEKAVGLLGIYSVQRAN